MAHTRCLITSYFLKPGDEADRRLREAGFDIEFQPRHGDRNEDELIRIATGNKVVFQVGHALYALPLESVREFKVLTGTFSAEFGRGAGVVSVSTKSGGNDFHGNLFEFVRNDIFDARNYFNAQPQAKPPFRRNQFGGAFSGPVLLPKIYNGKNKTFFFMDYFGMRERKGLVFVNTVPTAETRRVIQDATLLLRLGNLARSRIQPPVRIRRDARQVLIADARLRVAVFRQRFRSRSQSRWACLAPMATTGSCGPVARR